MADFYDPPTKQGATFWVLVVIAALLAVLVWYLIWGGTWLEHRSYCLSDQRTGLDTIYEHCMERLK